MTERIKGERKGRECDRSQSRGSGVVLPTHCTYKDLGGSVDTHEFFLINTGLLSLIN